MGSIGHGQTLNFPLLTTIITALTSIHQRVSAVSNADSAMLIEIVAYLEHNIIERWESRPVAIKRQLSHDINTLFTFLSGQHHGSLDELIRILQENLSVTMGIEDPVSRHILHPAQINVRLTSSSSSQRNLPLYLPTLGGLLESLHRDGVRAPLSCLRD